MNIEKENKNGQEDLLLYVGYMYFSLTLLPHL
jgi:hypothetical protein